MRLPSVRHYLIVKTENRAIIHPERDPWRDVVGEITTTIVRDGVIRLDPPGLRDAELFIQ